MTERDNSVEEVLRAIVDNEITEDRFPMIVTLSGAETNHDWDRRASRLRDAIVAPLVAVVEVMIENRPEPEVAGEEPTAGDLTKDYDTSSCGGPNCGRTIVWAITDKIAPMPLDPLPVENGNVEIVGRASLAPHIARPSVRVRKKADAASLLDEPVLLYVSHFVTCPDAESFRRK